MSEQPGPRESELIEYVRAIDVPAPAELHARIEAMVAEHAPSRREDGPARDPLRVRRNRRLAVAGLGCAVAALVAVLVVALSSGGGESSLRRAVALTSAGPTASAPAERAGAGGQLDVSVGGVSFPYWQESLGWRATGQREDQVAGHTVRTVFYADRRGRHVGYAIFAGSAPSTSGGHVQRLGGIAYRLLRIDGRNVVTWKRDGRLCVLSAKGVSTATLLSLAGWGRHPQAL